MTLTIPKKTFNKLPENYKAKTIKNLNNDLLPTGKKGDINGTNKVKASRVFLFIR